jgi:hypothetical protein
MQISRGIGFLRRPATDHLQLEAPVRTSLQTLLHSGDREAPCNSFMRWRQASAQSAKVTSVRQQGTYMLGAGAEKCSRQDGPSLYTSKRLARPWAGGRVLRSGVTLLTHGKAQGLRSICEV